MLKRSGAALGHDKETTYGSLFTFIPAFTLAAITEAL